MKKLFTVLAVLLVASLAFAGFSGSVKAGYTFDFDQRLIDYAKPGFAKVDASFKWDSQTYTVGEADGTHIEFAISAGFDGFYSMSTDHAPKFRPFRPSYIWADTFNLDDYVVGVTLHVDTFKIVGKNWEVSFISDLGLDFAKSAVDSYKFNEYYIEENEQAYTMKNSLKGKHNLVATVYDYKFGFGLGAGAKDAAGNVTKDWTDDVTFALTAVTPEYDFSGVKAQFGAGYEVVAEDYKFAASAKAAYATDKVAVSGAYDLLYANEFVKNDLAVNVAVAPVAVDVYFANDSAEAKDKYYDYFDLDDDEEDAAGNVHKVFLDPNYLSAKVVVDVAKVAENVPVTVTLTGKNLINEESQDLSVEAETTVVPNFKFGVYFKDWLCYATNMRKLGATVEFTGVQNLTLNGEVAYRFANTENEGSKKLFLLAGASYAHELFTASASVAAEKVYEQDMVLGAILSAKSTALVKGAELSAKAFFNLNDLDGLDDDADNKLALACKVSF